MLALKCWHLYHMISVHLSSAPPSNRLSSTKGGHLLLDVCVSAFRSALNRLKLSGSLELSDAALVLCEFLSQVHELCRKGRKLSMLVASMSSAFSHIVHTGAPLGCQIMHGAAGQRCGRQLISCRIWRESKLTTPPFLLLLESVEVGQVLLLQGQRTLMTPRYYLRPYADDGTPDSA